jgi:hypothetical protein
MDEFTNTEPADTGQADVAEAKAALDKFRSEANAVIDRAVDPGEQGTVKAAAWPRRCDCRDRKVAADELD